MLSRTGELWKSQGHVNISQLFAQLEELGYTLSRGHAKDTPSGGKLDTYQVMLVFDKPTIAYTEEQLEHNALTAFTDEDRAEVMDLFLNKVGPNYKVTIFANNAIARVPDHVYLKCGLPNAAKNRPSLEAFKDEFIITDGPAFSFATFNDILTEVEMVRLSLNITPGQARIIPKWLEKRERHDRTQSVASIGDSISRL